MLFKEKKLWGFFVFFFLVSLLAINWNQISWIFNQKAVYGELQEIVKKEELPEVVLAGEETQKADSIVIQKISVEAPIVVPGGTTEKEYQARLKKGVILYPDSSLPGEKGVTIILGHSAPSNWPEINYDRVFNEIDQLVAGDTIQIHFYGRMYTYTVKDSLVLDRGAEIPSQWISSEKPTLILLSCWPPGKDYKRYGVVAEIE